MDDDRLETVGAAIEGAATNTSDQACQDAGTRRRSQSILHTTHFGNGLECQHGQQAELRATEVPLLLRSPGGSRQPPVPGPKEGRSKHELASSERNSENIFPTAERRPDPGVLRLRSLYAAVYLRLQGES